MRINLPSSFVVLAALAANELGRVTTFRNLALNVSLRRILDRGAATAVNAIPKRAPDAVLEEKTVPTQAALYRSVPLSTSFVNLVYSSRISRLSGDTNPLHVSSYFHIIGTILSTDHLRFFLNSLRWVDSTSRSCMGFARWAYLANMYSRRSVLSKTSKFDLQASFTQAKH